jgi:hypothetical protein
VRAQRIEQTKSDDAPILNLCTCHDVPPSSIGGSTIGLSVTGGAQTFVVPMMANILRLIRPWSLRKRPRAESRGQGFHGRFQPAQRGGAREGSSSVADSSARANNHREKGPAVCHAGPVGHRDALCNGMPISCTKRRSLAQVRAPGERCQAGDLVRHCCRIAAVATRRPPKWTRRRLGL